MCPSWLPPSAACMDSPSSVQRACRGSCITCPDLTQAPLQPSSHTASHMCNTDAVTDSRSRKSWHSAAVLVLQAHQPQQVSAGSYTPPTLVTLTSAREPAADAAWWRGVGGWATLAPPALQHTANPAYSFCRLEMKLPPAMAATPPPPRAPARTLWATIRPAPSSGMTTTDAAARARRMKPRVESAPGVPLHCTAIVVREGTTAARVSLGRAPVMFAEQIVVCCRPESADHSLPHVSIHHRSMLTLWVRNGPI